jgi:hypothetical protein
MRLKHSFRFDVSRVQRLRLFILGIAVVPLLSCRVVTRADPQPAERTYCWWSSQYVAVAPIWIASRFRQALDSIGFRGVRADRDADSAWAVTSPTAFGQSGSAPLFSFRVVAFPASASANCQWRGAPDAPITRPPAGSAACFHTTVLIYPPRRAWASEDSAAAGSRVLSLCDNVYRSALAGLERLK